MKKQGGDHLKSIEANFQLQATEVETEWTFQATTVLPQLNNELSLKLLYKLLTQNTQNKTHISP